MDLTAWARASACALAGAAMSDLSDVDLIMMRAGVDGKGDGDGDGGE